MDNKIDIINKLYDDLNNRFNEFNNKIKDINEIKDSKKK